MKRIRARRILSFTFRLAEHIVSKIYRVQHIAPQAYRVPQAPKNKPRPLAEGVGEGRQRPNERFRAQSKSRAKIN